MKTTRRRFVKTVCAGALTAAHSPRWALGRAPAVSAGRAYDVGVVGAGVFGSWTALELQRSGRQVVLIDCYGPGNARASSGGQTRVIRMGYGDQEIYSRWSMRSLEMWKDLFRRIGRAGLFRQSGVLWMARDRDSLTMKTLKTLEALGVPHEQLLRPELEARWPQIDFGRITWAIHEPESGVLMAFHAVQAVAQRAQRLGCDYLAARVVPPANPRGRLETLATSGGDKIRAQTYVFACGAWLPKIFPEILGDRLFTTRQEVLFLGPPPGEERLKLGTLPAWADFAEEIYGIPDFKERGFKVALDRHGSPVDPDTMDRIVTVDKTRQVREYAGRRFPILKGAPVVGSAVCQYTNTLNGDFLVDRHPELDNVWLVGGGSGHGFKHGPALGEYVTARIGGRAAVVSRFSLATKQTVQKRAVF